LLLQYVVLLCFPEREKKIFFLVSILLLSSSVTEKGAFTRLAMLKLQSGGKKHTKKKPLENLNLYH